MIEALIRQRRKRELSEMFRKLETSINFMTFASSSLTVTGVACAPATAWEWLKCRLPSFMRRWFKPLRYEMHFEYRPLGTKEGG